VKVTDVTQFYLADQKSHSAYFPEVEQDCSSPLSDENYVLLLQSREILEINKFHRSIKKKSKKI
jgi:hypothetical protein